eukprot:3553254-Prymnesium_polylepis.1
MEARLNVKKPLRIPVFRVSHPSVFPYCIPCFVCVTRCILPYGGAQFRALQYASGQRIGSLHEISCRGELSAYQYPVDAIEPSEAPASPPINLPVPRRRIFWMPHTLSVATARAVVDLLERDDVLDDVVAYAELARERLALDNAM